MYKTHRTEGSVVKTHTQAVQRGWRRVTLTQGGSEQLVAASESWSASSELPSMEPKVLKHTARADAVRLAARPS